MRHSVLRVDVSQHVRSCPPLPVLSLTRRSEQLQAHGYTEFLVRSTVSVVARCLQRRTLNRAAPAADECRRTCPLQPVAARRRTQPPPTRILQLSPISSSVRHKVVRTIHQAQSLKPYSLRLPPHSASFACSVLPL